MKKIKIIAVLAILIFTLGCFIACKGEITALNATYETVNLSVGQKLDLNECIVKEGKGKLQYAIENQDVLSIDGSIVKALKIGKATAIITGGEFTVKIEISVNNNNEVNLSFDDVTKVYTGETFYVTPRGDYPNGTEIKYTCNGKEFIGASEAGIYNVTVTITVPKGFKLICEKNTCVLTIKKADKVAIGLSFPNKTFQYDGKEKEVKILLSNSGVLPEGITVSYENEKATEVGTYTAKAIFSGSNPNYEPFEEMQCTYMIEPFYCYLGDYGFTSYACTYDGDEHGIKISELPSGASVEYFTKDGNQYVPCENPSFVGSGTYNIFARLTINENLYRNYVFTDKSSRLNFTKEDSNYVSGITGVTLEINKAVLESGNLILRDLNGKEVILATYGKEISIGKKSEKGYTLMLEGGQSNGLKNEFASRINVEYTTIGLNEYGNVNVGKYTVQARFSVPSEFTDNYVPLKMVEYKLTVEKGIYDMGSVTFSAEKSEVDFDGTEYVFEVKGADLSPDSDYAIQYEYKCSDGTRSEVKHAGEYEIRAKFTLLKDWQNYYSIPDKIIKFKINPKIIEIEDISFSDTSVMYDGNGHSPQINGTLPDELDVTFLYEGDLSTTADDIYDPTFTVAGIYPVKAFVKYGDWDSRDYVIKINGIEIPYLTALFTVEKAVINEMPDFEYVESKLSYKPGMKLADIKFKDNENGYYSWKDSENSIKLSPITSGQASESNFVGGYKATVCYNTDKKNFVDAEKNVIIEMERYRIDASLINIPNQFVATGDSVFIQYPDKYKPYVEEMFTVTLTTSMGNSMAKVVLGIKSYNYYAIKEIEQPDGSILYENENLEYDFALYNYSPLTYEYVKGTCVLKSYKGANGNVTIPKGTSNVMQGAFVGKAVSNMYINDGTNLAQGVFDGITGIQSLNLPTILQYDSVKNLFETGKCSLFPQSITVRNDTIISAWAYQNMSALTDLIYESAVLEIKSNAFNGCTALKTFKTANPLSIMSVGQNAYNGCINLKEVYIPDVGTNTLSYYFGEYSDCKFETITVGGTEIASNAFKNVTGLKNIILSKDIDNIGAYAFSGCYAIIDFTSVVKLTEIKDNAFDGYKGAELTLPQGILKLGVRAFKNANLLSKLVLPYTIKEIGAECFYGCASLKTLNMPKELVSVGNSAFYATTSLTELSFSEKITTISELAFSKCAANITFVKECAVTEIGKHAFSEYLGKKVVLPSKVTNLGDKTFYNAVNLEEITLPAKLENIGEKCFEGCSMLKSVHIPENVVSIGSYAFYKCYSIATIVFGNTTPPAHPNQSNDAFTTEGSFFSVYVPKGTLNAYSAYLDACGAVGHYKISEIK